MKKLLLIFLLAKISSLNVCAQSSFQRAKFNFNSGWKVFVGDIESAKEANFSDGSWKNVTVPYAWNEDEAFKKDIADISTGIAWYRKHFKLPATAKGSKVFLEFEGIRQAGDFYLNGKYIGLHENGVMAFGFDVTDVVNFGDEENVLAVRIDNDWNYRERATKTKFQWEDKNFNVNYGGITKNVYLHITPKIYQTLPLFSSLKSTGVYIYGDNYNIKERSADIHAESEVKNETKTDQQVTLEVAVFDADGKETKKFSGPPDVLKAGQTKVLQASTQIKGLNFWSWGYGYLYKVQTTLKVNNQPVDVVTTTTGFRKTAFENGMIYLNDRVIMVHGYAQRTTNEWPAIGQSVPAWLSDYSNGLMVEGNGNLVRWMHVTPWKQDVESCDRVGLMQAMSAGDAEHDVEGVRWNQRVALMRDAIVYNRNNPSIVFYESGNESISENHMKDMKDVRDVYDPHGGRAIGSREMLDSKVAEYGGEMLYTNKSAHIPMWAMEYSRDEGSRKYWDDYTPPFHKDGEGPKEYWSAATNSMVKRPDASAYNRNMESHAVENVKRWYEFWRERPGTGRRVSSGGVNIIWSESNTHHRGEENFRRSGEVDAMRIKKQNFYSNQVMWDGWVIPEKQHLHIIGHWNYTQGVTKDIYVVSTAAKVELKVNGKSLGQGLKSDGFLFAFSNVKWERGTIAAIGYDSSGKVVAEDSIVTTGEPVALRLTAVERPTPFVADGHDVALVQVEVVDALGNRCPTALNMIHYEVNGPAEWRGGIAMGPDNYILSKSFPVEGGVNRFLLRATTQPGTVTVTATADGLKPATLSLNTKAYISNEGLSLSLPSQGLPLNLSRGMTPASPSFVDIRKSVNVVAASAGANSDSAFRSYDDNELSGWANDGKLNTAWIEYTLEKEATISEIGIKLNKFRSKSYNLRVTLDGREIFKGATQTSLGYYTMQCTPKKGKKVKIELLRGENHKEKDAGVEVNGKKLDDGLAEAGNNSGETLSIIEVDFYEK